MNFDPPAIKIITSSAIVQGMVRIAEFLLSEGCVVGADELLLAVLLAVLFLVELLLAVWLLMVLQLLLTNRRPDEHFLTQLVVKLSLYYSGK